MTAWALLCDSYHGSLCLLHRPDVIAVAVLHISLQCYGISVPPQDREATRLQWWQVLIQLMNLVHSIKHKAFVHVSLNVMNIVLFHPLW